MTESKRTNPPTKHLPRLMAVGFQGFGNVGDEAILCGLERIATVITDDGIDDAAAAMLEAAGVKLVVAERQVESEELRYYQN